MLKRIYLITAVIILTSYSILWAHGLEIEAQYEPPVVILKAVYDDHEAIGNAKITIHPPNYAENIYQSGVTDINGFFVFMPDAAGAWLVEVDDESGHKAKERVKIDSSFFGKNNSRQSKTESNPLSPNMQSISSCKAPVWMKLLLGFLIIFSLTIIFYYKKTSRN